MSQPLTGTAQSYSYPLTSGLLDHIGQAGSVGQWAQNMAGPQAQQAQMSQTPPDYTALALQLAGNPHAGPYSTAGNLVQPGSASNPTAGSTTGGSTGSSIAGGLLGTLAKNPSLVKGAYNAVSGLLGGLGAYGSGAAADAATTAALGNVGAQTAPTAASIEAGNDAALGAANGGAAGAGAGLLSMSGIGSGLAADSAVTGALGGVGAQTAGEAAAIQAANDAALGGAAAGGGAGSGAAATGALGAGAGAAAALGIAALPALLAAFVPDSSELTPQKIAQMENGITSATQANGGLLGAAYSQNTNGTVNPQHYQTLADLMTLESENPTEFAKAGGTGPITQYLQSMGYSPINWGAVGPTSQVGSGSIMGRGNTSGRQL